VKFDAEINTFMMNDLDTPKIILRLRAIEKESTIGSQDKRAIFLYADQLLGLDLDRGVDEEEPLSPEISQLLELRAAARANKNWVEADRLRDQLAELSIAVRDTADGQSWERTR
jgi:cysteinyl-tRNA synthetase